MYPTTSKQQNPPRVFTPNYRPFPPQHQQIPFAGPSQQQPRSQFVYSQQGGNYAGNFRHHDMGQQNHHYNHYQNYSNYQHAPQMIQPSHAPNVYQHRGPGNGVQNRLNAAAIEPPIQPQQVSFKVISTFNFEF
jgi:hypothetical protein